MTTSGEYTVTKSALTMAKAIFRILTTGRSPGNGEVDDIIEAINDWLFQIHEPQFALKPGEFMWQRETADLTLSSKAVYDLKPSGGDLAVQIPLELLTATRKDTDGNEVPMGFMDLFEYQEIVSKSETGTPSRLYYERRLDTGKVYLDYIPEDTTDVIDLVYRQPLEVITDQNETFDIANYFYRAMKYSVAVDVAPEYNIFDHRLDRIIALKAEAMAFVNSVNPEHSNAYFQPEIYE